MTVSTGRLEEDKKRKAGRGGQCEQLLTCTWRGESSRSQELARGKEPHASTCPSSHRDSGEGFGFAVLGQGLVWAVTPGLHKFQPGLRSCFSRELRAGLPARGWLPDYFCGGKLFVAKDTTRAELPKPPSPATCLRADSRWVSVAVCHQQVPPALPRAVTAAFHTG